MEWTVEFVDKRVAFWGSYEKVVEYVKERSCKGMSWGRFRIGW